MSLVSFSNVTKYFGSDLILDHVSFSVNKGEKVALIGANGTGKTTILKILLGEEEFTLVPKEDAPGSVSILGNIKIGYLSQNAITNINNTVKEELSLVFTSNIELINEFNEIVKKMTSAPHDNKYQNRYNALLTEIENTDAYNYEYKIGEYVSRFNFDLDILDKQISTLSGGEKMKVAFIKLLLFNYDLLLLDEPTNHLDISTIEWLENYLKTYSGTIFFVSHDRYFLNQIATAVLEVENNKTTFYNTGYDNFLALKKSHYETLLKLSVKEEKIMEKYQKFIDFYMPKSRFASRAKDREKKLNKLKANHVTPTKGPNKNIKFDLGGGNLKTKQLLEFKEIQIGYDHQIVPTFSFDLYGQDRIAVCGDNGIGKTTFIKSLLSEIPLLGGSIRQIRKLTFGYIKQTDYDFRKPISAISFLKERYPIRLESELRNALGRFLFRNEEVFKDVSKMSNGEQKRLSLCALSLSSYDVLLLDEPTNHLDMVTKECLIDSLKSYSGAIIFVSHDRYFINELATGVLYFNKQQSIFNEGNYDDLRLKLDKIDELKTIDEVEEKLKPKAAAPKLSNNKILEYQKRLQEIEEEIEYLDNLLLEDFEDYKKVEQISEDKARLEDEYFQIMHILEN